MLFSQPLKIRNLPRLLLIVLMLMALGALGHFWVQGEYNELKDFLIWWDSQWDGDVLLVGSLIYLLLLSLPFVPGVELGLLLMCVFGQKGILPIYFATVGGLMLAFMVGRLLPQERIDAWMERFGVAFKLDNAKLGFLQIIEKSAIGRFIGEDSRIGGYLKNSSHVVLALLLNLPGNYLLGGGGGIALFCGITRQFRWPGFLLTVVIATSPVPLLVWFGFIQLEVFLQLQTSTP